MANITLAMDTDLLQQARRYAQRHGTTLNRMVREAVARQVAADATSDLTADDLFRLGDEALATQHPRLKVAEGPSQRGWTRDDLYRR